MVIDILLFVHSFVHLSPVHCGVVDGLLGIRAALTQLFSKHLMS